MVTLSSFFQARVGASQVRYAQPHATAPVRRPASPAAPVSLAEPIGPQPALPAGWRWESYGGVQVGVPRFWGWDSAALRIDAWCVRDGQIRFAPALFNTEEEIDRCLEVTKGLV